MKKLTNYLSDKTGSFLADLGTLTLIFGIAFFQLLGHLPLTGTDEARYLEIPREMLERGDFVTPTLNYVKYFEKPPLHYWINALTTVIFGENAFAARFSGALFGVLGVLMTYHLGSRLFGRRAGLLSAVMLGTSVGFLTQARVNITDTTLTICMCASLGSFLLASRPAERHKGTYYHLFYVFAALAMLAKGLIGVVLPGLIIVVYIVLTRRWSLLKEMRLITGIPLFLLVCAPWFVLVSLKNPEFPYFFFIHEHFERYLTKVHGRYQPPWFYLPVLFGCLLPWSFLLPGALVRAWRKWWRDKDDATLFLALWGGLIFGFFSLSDSKLIPYILPIYVALALLIGALVDDALEEGGTPLKKTIIALGVFHLILGVGVIGYPLLWRAPRITVAGGALMGVILLAQGGFALLNRHRLVPLFCTVALMGYLFEIFAPPVIFQGIVERKVTRDLALMVKERAGSDAIVANFGYEQEFPLYTHRRMVVVGSAGELEFGSKQGDNKAWFVQHDQFKAMWSGTRPVFALVAKEDLPQLAQSLTPAPTLLGTRGKRCLITNVKGGSAAAQPGDVADTK